MSAVYAWPYLKRPCQPPSIFVQPVSALPSLVKHNQDLSSHVSFQLQSSLLQVADIALWQGSTGLHMLHDIDLRDLG